MENHLLKLLVMSKGGSNEATAEVYKKFLPLIKKIQQKIGILRG